MTPRDHLMHLGPAAIMTACARQDDIDWPALGAQCARRSFACTDATDSLAWADAAFTCYAREASALETPVREGVEAIAYGVLARHVQRFSTPALGVAACEERLVRWLAPYVGSFSSPEAFADALESSARSERLAAFLLRERLRVVIGLRHRAPLSDLEPWFCVAAAVEPV